MIARTASRAAARASVAIKCPVPLENWTKCRYASSFPPVDRPGSSSGFSQRPSSASLGELLDTLQSFRVEARRPTKTAYIRILDCLADYASRRRLSVISGDQKVLIWRILLGTLRDAASGSVALGAEQLPPLFKLASIFPEIRPALSIEIDALPQVSADVWEEICRQAIKTEHLEHLYVTISRMIESHVAPSEYVSKHAIRLACEWACPRLGLQLARWLEQHAEGGRVVEVLSWVQILIASAENQYLEGVEIAWRRATRTKSFTPDEGIILTVLGVAGRWGRPDMAVSALEVLPSISVVAGEHHLAPLLEAYVNAGQLPDAFRVLSSLRSAGISPTMGTAAPIISRLHSPDTIDQAFFALEDMHRQGTLVDISALNAVIKASANLGDIKRARATQIAVSDFGLKPDVDTFNTVLRCCVDGGYRQLGETVFSEISGGVVAPNVDTYDLMIRLSLGEVNYEDAFYYLEKMKAQGITPSYRVYARLLETCVERKDRRWRLVVEELESLGYRIEPWLRDLINKRSDRPRPSVH
ncbi:hypothetical protein BCR39DRAFT_480763 [Naematelia encephala]|uniref:Pentatricopeptide repeat-containing protein-mitochondrial domain-containing protein n=1 Tax=Naematelia encephala TaxID=71784 RepID=A0A1Y2B781_9TREE|nr:hypothetical protein BCR39DRAFT_480763 [Naematelia encephala]